jgi:hypothetical protein
MRETPKKHNEEEKAGLHPNPDTPHQLEPDKVIHADGTVSDAELYKDILDDPDANAVADAVAMQIAVELGFTPEEAQKMCGGKATSGRPKRSRKLEEVE